MGDQPIEKLLQLGFSEYEAKAYLALLEENPATGYQVAKKSGVPRSMIYEVIGKLLARHALMTYRVDDAVKYAPVSPVQFLDNLNREHDSLITSLKQDLGNIALAADPDYIWNLEGNDNILAKAVEMIRHAKTRIYLAIAPSMFPMLREALETAVLQDVKISIYTTRPLDIEGCRIIVAHVSEETLEQSHGLALILVVDGNEVLIGEWLSNRNSHGSWTSNPLIVFIAEHHLRTDLYLPHLLACLGEDALNLIDEDDRELFARAMESEMTC